MEYKDYYKILEVDRKANEKDIKHSYRRLAQKYHPDKNPNDKSSEDKFKEINEAYEVIGTPEKRAKYDQLGASYHRYQQMGGAPGGFDFSQWSAAGNPSGTYQRVNIDLDDLFSGSGGFSDFFNNIFGGGFQSQRRGQQDLFSRQVSQRGQDIEHQVDITLEEAYHGTARRVNRENGEQFTAKIPKGAKNGTKVRLRGKGAIGPAGPGDLYLVVKVRKHDRFSRNGDNLEVTVPVNVTTAVLGGKVEVPTLSGPVKLTIPPGSQGGRTFRLRGKGMPQLRQKNQFGDLHARIQIQVPDTLDEEERQLYEQLAEINRR
jgi:curved DNA-binding protein